MKENKGPRVAPEKPIPHGLTLFTMRSYQAEVAPLIKKIGSKQRPVEALVFDDQTPADLNSLAGELVFDYPSEVEDAIKRVQSWVQNPQATEPGLTVPEHILRMFENEATALLALNQYPTSLTALHLKPMLESV